MRFDAEVDWKVELPDRGVQMHLPYHFRQGGIAYLEDDNVNKTLFGRFLLKLRQRLSKKELPFMIVPGWEGDFYLIHLKHGVYLSIVDWSTIFYLTSQVAKSCDGYVTREKYRPFLFKFSPRKEAE